MNKCFLKLVQASQNNKEKQSMPHKNHELKLIARQWCLPWNESYVKSIPTFDRLICCCPTYQLQYKRNDYLVEHFLLSTRNNSRTKKTEGRSKTEWYQQRYIQPLLICSAWLKPKLYIRWVGSGLYHELLEVWKLSGVVVGKKLVFWEADQWGWRHPCTRQKLLEQGVTHDLRFATLLNILRLLGLQEEE